MSIFAGPKIVEEGLVLYLDAANPKSYPGSGTTWTDLINQTASTLTNGPAFNSSNKGYFEFDGIDDYTIVPDASNYIQDKTNITFGVIFKMKTLATLRGLIGNLNYSCTRNLGLVASSSSLSFYNDTTTCYNISLSNWIEVNKWLVVFGTYDGTTTKLYGFKDGVLTTSSGTSKSGSTNTFTSTFRVFGNEFSSYFTHCDGSMAFLYNRTLSEAEIKQNFEALRGRYGI
jgi:hypothetical protein